METLSPEFFHALKLRLLQSNTLSLQVVTDSMWPLIKPGTMVTVAPLTSPLKPGCIVLFYENGKLICHMVKKSSSEVHDGRVLCGGLKKGFDLPVLSEHILGRVVSHEIGFKEIVYSILSQLGFIK